MFGFHMEKPIRVIKVSPKIQSKQYSVTDTAV